jgi:hypothetical protein
MSLKKGIRDTSGEEQLLRAELRTMALRRRRDGGLAPRILKVGNKLHAPNRLKSGERRGPSRPGSGGEEQDAMAGPSRPGSGR